MIARKVEWRNSFREYVGVVVAHSDNTCTVLEINDLEQYTVPDNKVEVIGPGVTVFAEYRRQTLLADLDDEFENPVMVYDEIISELEALTGDSKFLKSRDAAIASELKLKAAIQRATLDLNSDDKFVSHFSCDDKKADYKGGDEKQHKDSSDEEDDEEEEEDDEQDSSSDDSSSSSSDGGSSSSSEDEDEDTEEEEEDDEDDEELPNNDIRGFSVPMSRKGLSIILKSLCKDYGKASVFFRDSDGDVVTIRSEHDLQYAYRSFIAMSTSASDKSAVNENITLPQTKMKLFAEVISNEPSSTHPRTRTLSSSDRTTANTTADVALQLPSEQGATAVRFSDSQGNGIGNGIGSSMENSYQRVRHALGASMNSLEGGSLAHDAYSVMSASGAHLSDGSHRHHDPNHNHNNGEHGQQHSPSHNLLKLNYEVIWKKGELLGSGSFGKVYSGINLATGERMAVKEVTLRRGKKYRQQAQALQLEVKILSSLDHSNIIRYYGTEFTKQTLRIFLELANSGTVKDAINEFGAFPESLV
eukprot:CAMPEP_0170450012 /NCGR_PEP_ID=MMETSP0117_2-20130122/51549_1 /TAXON_ID=400756 /ORGANISM="Durinskia baltica, Strain CSIRO CS-38" /LENGTH=529 /DNA_ID=CAMNT_0010711289 /DNA_START=77 /DNA_END=1663 /DNA_ORIENTATION=+